MGLSVSKKVGVAVKRNAVRRRLREIFRFAASDLPGGVDVVVSARAAAADAGFDELNEEFHEAYLSAEPSKASQDPRVPQAHEYGRRAQDHRLAAPAGAQAASRLIFVPT